VGRAYGPSRRHVNFFGSCPTKQGEPGHGLLHARNYLQGEFPPHSGFIRKALELVCAGHITASVFVNKEEPLANLLEVMRHLMSHNGHLKTAIVRKCPPWAQPRFCPGGVRPFAGGTGAPGPRKAGLHALWPPITTRIFT
jgi:hypothetical protein